jgi:hypothetical protein
VTRGVTYLDGMHRAALLLLTAAALVLAGCGGGDSSSGGGTGTTGEDVTLTAPGWAGPLLAKPGPEAALVMATSDFAAGPNRVGFLLVRDDGSLIDVPRADVYYRPRAGGPTRRTTAARVQVGVKAGAEPNDEVKHLYAAELDLPKPGKQWIVVQPRGVRFQGFQVLDVKAKPAAVAIGERAPASDNPTIDREPASRITTADPPDVGLLRYSVADSLAKHAPFVVAFATPAFCQSRTCGPTVDVVDAVRRRFDSRGIRFIHIEIYEDNTPGNGVNRWVREWRLPSEPWVFIVGRDGIVRDRFEGAVSVAELSRSVRRHLL